MALSLHYGFNQVAGYQIPTYFFTAPDASTHIADLLSDPEIGFFYHGDSPGLDWGTFCSDAAKPFLAYSTFLVCLLYANVTRNLLEGTLPTNLTELGYSLSNDTRVSKTLRSTYPTCLVAYCASQSDCASTNVCEVGSLLTQGYELSSRGVAECFQLLCSLNVQVVNPDIAGIGILLSYLMQSVISFLGFFVLASLALYVHWHSRKTAVLETATANSEDENLRLRRHNFTLHKARHHWAVVNLSLAEFHKNQCYFAIALQIASCVVIFSDLGSTTFIDQNFLLLVSLAGLVPVILTLYTLMVFGKKSWYMTILSVISVVLSSTAGGYITSSILTDPNAFNPAGGPWPDACGNIGPQVLCAAMGPNLSKYEFNVKVSVFAIIVIMDITTALLVLWQVLFHPCRLWSTVEKQLTGWLPEQGSISYEQHTHIVHLVIKFIFHALIASGIVACLAIEFYFFAQLFLNSPYVDFSSWGFGQIVGLTTWFGTIIEVAYLEYFGVEGGSDWRWPKWLHVVGVQAKSTHQLEPMDDDNRGSNLVSEFNPPVKRLTSATMQGAYHG